MSYGADLVDQVTDIAPHGIDAAVDAVGGAALTQSVEVVEDLSRVTTLVDHDAARRLGTSGTRAERSVAQLVELVALYERGLLDVHIRAEYPLGDVRGAHRDIEAGHGRGKIVITVH